MVEELVTIPQVVVWQLMVAVYLSFVGISAGAYILSSLSYVLGFRRYEPMSKLSLITALVFAVLAPVAIAPHLTQPSRLFTLLLTFHQTSPLSWGAFILSSYVVVILIYGRFAFRGDLVERFRSTKGLKASFYKLLALNQLDLSEVALAKDLSYARISGFIGLILATLTVYTGFELSAIKAQPLWHLSFSPLMLMMTAISSGFAFALVLYALARRYILPEKRWDVGTISDVGKIIGWILFISLVLLAVQGILSQYSTADAKFAFEYLFSGDLAPIFGLVVIVLGTEVPLVIFAVPSLRKSPAIAVAGGALTVLGSFATRYSILITAQLIPKTGATFLKYTPALEEIGQFIGVTSLGALLFMLALWILPWEHKLRLGAEL